MIDPVSMGAVAAVFGAVGSGMAGEAGERAWESAGGPVSRPAGREVPAPATSDELDALARMIHDRVHDGPELAPIRTRFARGVRTPGRLTGPAPSPTGTVVHSAPATPLDHLSRM
ncbi:hypothetical protein AB0I51_28470 [Streptomyces sp. NPDC050549]|uniref:hypothetical protein n=1 Tax=Streptomyces sp. NPDC050549 TaxID=3155406 RepID=UPI0034229312